MGTDEYLLPAERSEGDAPAIRQHTKARVFYFTTPTHHPLRKLFPDGKKNWAYLFKLYLFFFFLLLFLISFRYEKKKKK